MHAARAFRFCWLSERRESFFDGTAGKVARLKVVPGVCSFGVNLGVRVAEGEG